MEFFTKKEIEAIDKGIYEAFARRDIVHSASMRRKVFDNFQGMINEAYGRSSERAKLYLANLHRRAKSKKPESSQKYLKEYGEMVGYEAYIIWVAEDRLKEYASLSNYGSVVIGRDIVKVFRGRRLSIMGKDVYTFARENPKFEKTLNELCLSVEDLDASKQIKDEDAFIDYSEKPLPKIDQSMRKYDPYAEDEKGRQSAKRHSGDDNAAVVEDEDEEELPNIEDQYNL